MNIILETERLELVKFSVADADFILRLLNTPGWLENISARNINSISDAENYITNKLIPSYDDNGFGVRYTPDTSLVHTRRHKTCIYTWCRDFRPDTYKCGFTQLPF